MKTLAIDIETYSSVDLIKCGVYKYAESQDFEILLFGYAFSDDPVQVIDLTWDELPDEVLFALTDPNVIKTAFNANFERTCISKHYNIEMPPEQWRCTAVHSLMLGLPGHLDGVAKALRIQQQKDSAGKALIRFFSLPCKETKANGGRSRNMPSDAPDKWEAYMDYCRQDVIVEREIRKVLDVYPVPDSEQALWALDQRINDCGVRVDPVLVNRAVECDGLFQERLVNEAMQITGLENPKSVSQLKEWLQAEEGIEIEKLNKETVPKLIKDVSSDTATRVLEIRQLMAKTSVTKYKAMERAMCSDHRVRGLLQFYGANRTGRWAGRLVQVQNLPQNKIPDLDLARQLLLGGNYELIETIFDSVPDILSQLIRTAFVPNAGHRFIVADFSAIEARVIAWLAGEQWRLDVFETHGKIYEASAAQMFKVPIESIGKGSPLRQKGKVAELALGYQGGPNALVNMGALKMGLTEDDLPGLVNAWRDANPSIVALWNDAQDAAIRAVRDHETVEIQQGITFYCEGDSLFIKLPSGRSLAYVNPRIEVNKFGRDSVTYEGVDQVKKTWTRIPTYGGKLVENIVQAVARDCLAESMMRLDDWNYRIVMSVHDEVVLEVPEGMSSADEVAEIMGQEIGWAPGLPLRADAYECSYYRKD